MRIKHLIILVVLVLALISAASPARAGGVVTVCDEAHLLAALAGGGMVTFACSGVITLSNTITIAADTTVDGNGQEVTISGNDAVRVFTVDAGVTLVLGKLTIADGKFATPGGGIYNNGGTLVVSNSHFSGNSTTGNSGGGGGIVNANNGTLVVRNSTFSGNSATTGGGAIYSGFNGGGTLTVNNSTFFGNSAAYGGCIYNVGTTVAVNDSSFSSNIAAIAGGVIFNSNNGMVTVSNSTFSGNRANSYGGGGVHNWGGTLSVSNSTFASNSANTNGGGIHNDLGTTIVSNSTFFGNGATQGGGLYNDSGNLATLKNTIVANSLAGSNCSGAITDGGGNLSYPDSTCPGINADPLLGPLQDNGGLTWTMALGPGSAAIDAADDAICAADPINNRDQRGVIRPQGVHCDIGAFERPIKWLPIMLVQ